MMRLKRLTAVFVLAAALLCGCTQSNIVSPTAGTVEGDGQPDTEINKDIAIDWEELREDLRDEYLEPYGKWADYVMDLAANYDAAGKTLTVLLPVSHKTTGEIAVGYSEAVLKSIGTIVATQNFYYTAPDENQEGPGYGSFFDENDLHLQVFFYDEEGNTDTYLIDDTIKAGEQRAPEARVE